MFRLAAIDISFPSVTELDRSRSSRDCTTIIGWKRRSHSVDGILADHTFLV